MRATWAFRACRTRHEYTWIRRSCGRNTITGTEHDALDFARKVAAHLDGVHAVEAWTVGSIQEQLELPGLVIFPIVPHENGKDWRALETHLHHGGWYRPEQLELAIDYALWRGGGTLCAVQVTNRAGALERVVLADLRKLDFCPARALPFGR
jgi:hypothetical protein